MWAEALQEALDDEDAILDIWPLPNRRRGAWDQEHRQPGANS